MRAPAAATLVLALLLAGCSDGGNGDPVDSTGPVGTATATISPAPSPSPGSSSLSVDLLPDFAFEGCRRLSVQSPQPIDQVQSLLPEGFTAAPAPFATDGVGFVGLDLYACGNLTTPSTRIAGPYFGQLYTHILPPSDRVAGAPQADVSEYAFRLLAADDVLARLWPAAGYDTRNGTATVGITSPSQGLPVDAGTRLGNASVGADYSLRAFGSPPPAPPPPLGTFARYTALSDGSVLVWTGRYDFAVGHEGHGTYSVADDDPFAGFEAGDNLSGVARIHEAGSVLEQDLRRFF
ncbi:MAG: hypothetical protein ACYC2H_01695 [Thermoplasmatota archaeon]